METGYYWAYTKTFDGERIESDKSPIIVYYNTCTDEVLVMGYDQYCPASSYEVVSGVIEFDPFWNFGI